MGTALLTSIMAGDHDKTGCRQAVDTAELLRRLTVKTQLWLTFYSGPPPEVWTDAVQTCGKQ